MRTDGPASHHVDRFVFQIWKGKISAVHEVGARFDHGIAEDGSTPATAVQVLSIHRRSALGAATRVAIQLEAKTEPARHGLDCKRGNSELEIGFLGAQKPMYLTI